MSMSSTKMKKSSSGINYLSMAQERRRLQNEQDENIFRRSIFTDKNSKKAKLFYDKQEHKFSKQDIPIHKLQQKQLIKDTVEPDVLELKKKNWNASATIPVNSELEEPHDRRLWKIKLGLADGQNVKYKPYYEYPGVESRNIFSGWNSSTFLDQRRGNNYAISKPAQLYNEKQFVPKDRTGSLLPLEYRSPSKRQIDYTRFVREQKKEEHEIRDQLRDIYTYEYPDSSIEKVNAGVFRLNYETKLKAGKLKQIKEDTNCTFTPDISRTVKRNKVAKQYHSGVWMKFTKEKDSGKIKENWAYSCCISDDFNSPGCCTVIKDKDKRNLVGFTNS